MVKRFCDEKENHVPHPQLGSVEQSAPAKRKPDDLGERGSWAGLDDGRENGSARGGAAVHGDGDPDAGDGAGGLPVGGMANAGLFGISVCVAEAEVGRAGSCDLGAAAIRRIRRDTDRSCIFLHPPFSPLCLHIVPPH